MNTGDGSALGDLLAVLDELAQNDTISSQAGAAVIDAARVLRKLVVSLEVDQACTADSICLAVEELQDRLRDSLHDRS
jgi:hypothetical protein